MKVTTVMARDVQGPARRPRVTGGAAAVACALVIVVTVVGFGAAVVMEPGAALLGHVYEDTCVAVVWAALGLLLARRAPANPLGGLFLLVAASAGLSMAAGGYGQLADGRHWPGAVAAAWVGGWGWTASTFIPVTILLLWFPDGRPRTRGSRVLTWAAIAGIVLMTSGLALTDRIEVTEQRSVSNPVAVPGADGLFVLGSVLVMATAVATLGVLVRRMLHANGDRRRQIAPVAVAACLALPALIVVAVVPGWSAVIQTTVMPLLPAAVTLAVLRYRLFEVEVVVRRSLVLVGLTVLVVGGYAFVVQVTAAGLHRRAGLPESLVATGLVALAFQPARVRLQRVVGRLLYGERDTPLQALTSVGERLAAEADPQEALAQTADQLRRSLRVPWVAVRTDDGQVVAAGQRPAWADDDMVESLPMLHLGVCYGEMAVCWRSPHDRLSPRDRVLLEDLVVPVAAVVAADRMIAELRRSRESVVLAREEERRRLRRDLHDGLGPILSAIVTHADVAVLRLARQDRGAVELVERVGALSSDAVSDLRRVVEGLRPATVDELGLGAALQELARSVAVPGICEVLMDVHAGRPASGAAPVALPELETAVEVAVYRIVAEALTNAQRHGRASQVRVTVVADAEEGEVVARIEDNGRGVAPDGVVRDGSSSGLGLASMRRRAHELGGRLEWWSGSAGGFVVHATLPLRSDGRGPLSWPELAVAAEPPASSGGRP